MTSFTVLRNFTSIAVAACAIGVSSGSAQTYSVTDLGTLPGQKVSVSTPAAINSQGLVAGTSGASAFRYTSSNTTPMEDIGGDPKNSITRGFAINFSGQVVGDSTFKGGNSHAALFSKGGANDLGTLQNGGAFSRANGINASGQVVGFTSEAADLEYGRAFIVSTSANVSIDPNDMIDLGTLGGSYAQALGINDAGFVTGNSQVERGGSTHAFIWAVSSRMVDLGTLGADYSYGTAINVNNHVAGYSTISYADDRMHAFLHDGNNMMDLGSLGGASMESDRSVALGMNAADQVVGYSYLPAIGGPGAPQQVAFVYRQGLMLNLNDLIGSASSEFQLYSATAINDSGRIVALALVTSTGTFHAVLLTPIRPIDIDPVSRTAPAKR